jgi:predicted ATP-grasp superfamily ATP-dependent carboligase
VRSLAESAIRAGFRPLCVDFFEDADLQQLLRSDRGRMVAHINGFDEIPERIRSIRHDIPCVWAGGLENHLDVLEELSTHRQIVGPNLEIVGKVRNPVVVARWLRESGFRIPLTSQSPPDSKITWLRKSLRSSGGLGVTTELDGASHAITQEQTPLHIYQEYIDGVSMSAVLISDSSGLQLLGTSMQLAGWSCLGASEFQFCGNIGPIALSKTLYQTILSAGQVLADQGLRGVFGIDFILRNGELWFLEVNPRMTASHMVYEATGRCQNLFSRHLSTFGYQSTRPCEQLLSSDVPNVVARLIVWTRTPIRTGKRFAQETWRISDTCRISDVPPQNSAIPASSPVFTVELRGDSFFSVIDQVQQLHKQRTVQALCDWLAVAKSLRTLHGRFESNTVHGNAVRT